MSSLAFEAMEDFWNRLVEAVERNIDADPDWVRVDGLLALERDTDAVRDSSLHEESWTAFTADGDVLVIAKSVMNIDADERANPWTIGFWPGHEDGELAPEDFLRDRYADRDAAVQALRVRAGLSS